MDWIEAVKIANAKRSLQKMYQIPFRAIDLADGEWINGTCYGRTIEEARKALKDIKLTGQVDEDIFIDTSTLEINLDGIVM